MKKILSFILSLTLASQGATYWLLDKNTDGVGSKPKVTATNSTLFSLNGSGVLTLLPQSTFATSTSPNILGTAQFVNWTMDGTMTLQAGAKTSGTFAPSVTNTDDLGTTSLRYRGLFLSGNATVAGTVSGSNLSGTNTGDITLGAFGSAPDAKGFTLSGQVLTLQPADATHPGAVTTGAQTWAGAKTLTSTLTISGGDLVVSGNVNATGSVLSDGVPCATTTGVEALANKTLNGYTFNQSVASGATPTFTGTNFTGISIATGISGLGTGIATALAINTGTAGSVQLNNGSGSGLTGTASSLTAGAVTNLTLGGATTISTGGTIALGGYTLTVPATGTAALLGTANTFTAANTLTVTPAASTPSLKLTNTPYSAGTATTNFPLLYLNDSTATASTTLSTAGTYFGVNGHGSADLLNLLLDGTSKLKVDSTGAIFGKAGSYGTPTLRAGTAGSYLWLGSGNSFAVVSSSGSSLVLGDGSSLAFQGNTLDINGTGDAKIVRVSAGVINLLGSSGFTRLNFGGTTSSAAAFQTSGTGITVGLADGTAGGSFTASGTLAVTGNSTFDGNLTTTTVGKTLAVKSGTNALAGTVTLVAGTATITSTAIDANTVIVLSLKTSGGTPGMLAPRSDVASGSATITGTATDTSTYNWVALKVN